MSESYWDRIRARAFVGNGKDKVTIRGKSYGTTPAVINREMAAAIDEYGARARRIGDAIEAELAKLGLPPEALYHLPTAHIAAFAALSKSARQRVLDAAPSPPADKTTAQSEASATKQASPIGQ